MLNIYEQIDLNKRRSIWIVILFVIFISFFGYAIAYLYGYDWSFFIFMLFVSSFGSVITYFNSDKLALSLAQAVPANQQLHRRYLDVVANISRVANIPEPKAYIIPSPALNAFATGRDPEHSAIAVTQGLLDQLNRTELEGVVAHEISHIRNFDTRLMTIVAILVGSITIILNQLWRFGHVSRGGRDRNNQNPFILIIGFLLIILAPIIAKLTQLAISRRREFFADASAVLFTRQPSGLISALKKIDQVKTPLNQATPATAPLYISNPVHDTQTEKWLGKLFSTHPPISERIKALEGRRI